ncbi:MAG: hypothetical protein A2033_15615 [Bacteroidetes bacterium GWA2_31_9]|nr:MAG: hypothetical protein A2033_15615 [Bacteroidetes bacterium GWA2_31_9]
MRSLEIQTKKLNIIEQLIILNDDKVFKKIEDIINNSLHRPQLKKFTKQELVNRAKLSNKNIENGEIYSQDEVEKMSKSW